MCTDVLIVSEKNGQKFVVNGRSQEFAFPLGYRVMFRKKGVPVQVNQPTKPSGPHEPEAILATLTPVDLCTSKYDYAGIMITAADESRTTVSTAVFDGLNSGGLSVGSLNADGSKYQPKSNAKKTNDVFAGFFVDWLLSNYATCEEVKDAFAKDEIRVVAENAGGFDAREAEDSVHLHFAVHDAGGKSLVIEFIDHEAKLTDNPVGVLTNLPVFSWHLTNLGMYAHLSNLSSEGAVKFGKVAYRPPGSLSAEPSTVLPEYRSTGIPGMGDGLAGIPGDFRPPSRFVRTAYMKKFAVPPATEQEAVSQAFHLLNGVDIVKGASAEKNEEGEIVKYDIAQCVMVKDLVNKVLYVRMYESPMPYAVSFSDCPYFAPGSADLIEGVSVEIPTGSLAMPLLGSTGHAGRNSH
jgi:choloylglycine hydrolase